MSGGRERAGEGRRGRWLQRRLRVAVAETSGRPCPCTGIGSSARRSRGASVLEQLLDFEFGVVSLAFQLLAYNGCYWLELPDHSVSLHGKRWFWKLSAGRGGCWQLVRKFTLPRARAERFLAASCTLRFSTLCQEFVAEELQADRDLVLTAVRTGPRATCQSRGEKGRSRRKTRVQTLRKIASAVDSICCPSGLELRRSC